MAKHEFTDDQLKALLDEHAKRVADAVMLAMSPKSSVASPDYDDPDAQFAEIMAKRRGKDRPATPDVAIRVKSPETGSSFTAVVQGGRVIRLDDYSYPQGVETHTTEGGLVPHGLGIHLVSPNGGYSGQFTVEYKQWRYETFWKADLHKFIGHPLPKSLSTASE